MLEFNGKMYARVSDIIKPFVNFGSIPQEVLDKKAAIGTSVHNTIEEEIKGLMPIPIPEARGYVKSFEKWRVSLKAVFIETEMRYYCDITMITGKIDGLIKIEGNEPAILIDFKTSAQESLIVWIMQAHLYHYLLQQSGKVISNRFLFIKLDKHGMLPIVYEYKFYPNVRAKCMQAIDEFWKSIEHNH